MASEKISASAEVAANDAALARTEAEQVLERITGERKDLATNVNAQAAKKPQRGSQRVTAPTSRVGMVAVVALMLGAGAGYLARTPSPTATSASSTTTSVMPVAISPAAALIPAPAADEPMIELHLDRNFESVSRIRPVNETTSKKSS